MKSHNNLIESMSNPVLVKGGPSSSNLLNEIHNRIQSDIYNLYTRLEDLDRTNRLVTTYVSQQSEGIQGIINHLETLIPASPAGRGVADFFSSDYVANDNTAEIDTEYGQVTLPVLSVQNKLSHVDSQGNTWVPEDCNITYHITDSYEAGVIPDLNLFKYSAEDHYGIGSQVDRFFLGGEIVDSSYLYLKISVPQVLNIHKLSNRLTFTPVPCFKYNLINAYYRDTNGTWTAIDFSYIVGYNETTEECSLVGPTRLHFSPTEVTDICLVLRGEGYWGLQRVALDLVEYDNSANLITDVSSYNLSSIRSMIIGGKDPLDLAGLSSVINNNEINISLTQVSSYTTPVITYIDVRS